MPSEQPRSDASTLKPILMAVAVFALTSVALDSAILAKGLRGGFATTEVVADGSLGSNLPGAISGGGAPPMTEGSCMLDVQLQATGGEIPVGVPTDWHPDNNVIVKLADSSCDVGVSPTWTVANWNYTIVQIAPNGVFKPPAPTDDERQLLKIIRGTLLDVNLNGVFNGAEWETYVVTPPNRPISQFIDNSVDEINAGAEGAVIVYMKVTEEALKTPITDMAQAPATVIAGPHSDNLKWTKFGAYFSDFADVEFYNLAGILLQENDGSRLCYMQFWTMREDMEADGYHDHSNLATANAFAEIHMATYAANGVSGMQTTLTNALNLDFVQNPDSIAAEEQHRYNDNNQTELQIAIPMPPGHAHGPLWSVDPASGEPTFICAGGIQYPKHRWLISANGPANAPLRYSMWVAFEHLPQDATVPLKMLTEWPNANLQSSMDPVQCANN